jgi:phage/plasmid-like protein (TIGR03299 family)
MIMHLIETMAYAGETPWHGLGNKLTAHQPIDVWKKNAGMDWQIDESEVGYVPANQNVCILKIFPGQKVLYRSDTLAPLAVVSKRYQVVQPGEILEFYRDLTEVGGFELESAGVLKEGRKFWALARTGQSATLRGRDQVNGYLLLATACDGTLATTAQFTSVRVVCNNTLAIALSRGDKAIKVPHRSRFDAASVKKELGLTVSTWDRFVEQMTALSEIAIDPDSVDGLLRRVFAYSTSSHGTPTTVVSERAVAAVQTLYNGAARGAQLTSSRGTAWGVVNSVTEYVDFHRQARSVDHRRDAAWFGQGAQIKQRAWAEAVALLG